MLLKEELVKYLMSGYIHVSRQDYLFFTNIDKLANENRVTTGQDALLNKLVDKYKRQLKNQNLDTEQLKKLSWNHILVQTKPEYLRAELSLVDNDLILRTPFNKAFNQSLRKLEGNTFTWDKHLRIHKSPASTYSLLNIIKLIAKHFSDYRYCDNIKTILDQVSVYDNLIWDPTMVEIHGRLYILACNEVLYEQFKNIDFKKDSKTFFKLGNLGIKFSDQILVDEELKFAGKHFYEIDIQHIETLCDYIKNLGFTEVNMGRHILSTRTLYAEVRDKFLEAEIQVSGVNDLSLMKGKEYILIQLRNAYSQNLNLHNASKVIFIKNSNPINIT